MEDYSNYVRTLILNKKKPSYSTTNKKEVRIRCPYCGDSRKDPKSAHLYIAMTPPFKFHCFKCETSGVLNLQTMREMGIVDNDLYLNVVEANKLNRSNSEIAKISYKTKNLAFDNECLESTVLDANTSYFNNRYGTDLDPNYISSKFKAVLDITQFAKTNQIYIPYQNYNFNSAIGFASSDNSHIVFRDTSGIQPKRYYNLNLFQDNDMGNKFYNISSEIDIMEPEINLVITEGIFDIIGVYLHFYKDTPEEKNTIFAAACGKGYAAVIAHYIRMGFLNLNVIIYSDADVDLEFFKNLKKSSIYLKNSRITIYYNSLYNKYTGVGKDFGVPKSQIQLRRVIV